MRNQKGITLVALIITIIILLILAIVSISLVINGGIIGRAERGTDSFIEAEIKEKVNLAYKEWGMKNFEGQDKTLKDLVEERLSEYYGEENVVVTQMGKGIVTQVTKNGKDYEYTLMPDGSMEEGKFAYLDIADGNIDLYENGYTQYTGSFKSINKNNVTTTYSGKYVITGTTKENVVRVCNEGNYDITIKDLNIDVSNGTESKSPFNTNAGGKATGCFVNLVLEGNNYIKGKNKPGLLAGGGTPNINGVTNGSSLIIEGNGILETIGHSPVYDGAGIGGQTNPSGQVSNIKINSGSIIARCTGHGSAIRRGVISKSK